MSECEAAACLIIALIIDDDDKKTRNKKVDTAKRGERDVSNSIQFLTTGETYHSLNLEFRVSERAISYIIDEVTKVIVQYIGKDNIRYHQLWRIGQEYLKHFNRDGTFPIV